ncbi:hypothetical protein BU25DRAFT_478147 [Macroventuria anomochaeta]|uniref:Uncharacterized protein n=1 Tax=Macroventuria anomochaeta TaxID=301207 RepID=A0ACB6RNI6_9PLEO|nr:uncharacterized protein BU25DRAFT_478147 [Macroventuria anomochaeta]KAF2623344.1 hypothetical protein BU25DRAFT_478147 [Macroventuria anomochaeta]
MSAHPFDFSEYFTSAEFAALSLSNAGKKDPPEAQESLFNKTRADDMPTANRSDDGCENTTRPKPKIYYYLSKWRISQDRLCLHSAFFRNYLQDERRIGDDCYICYESLYLLDDTQSDVQAQTDLQPRLTCCISCGQTFHLRCIKYWRVSSVNSRAGDRCPWCRRHWILELSSLFPTLAPAAVEAYIDCILHGRTEIRSLQSTILVKLILCYHVGFHFLNQGFCLSVMKAIFEWCNKISDIPRGQEIKMIYEMTGCYALRAMVVEIWVQWKSLGWDCLKKEATELPIELPNEFLLDLRAVRNRHPLLQWHQMPVTGLLEVKTIEPDLIRAIDRDFEMATASSGKSEGSNTR